MSSYQSKYVLKWELPFQLSNTFWYWWYCFQGLKSFSSEYVTSFALKQKMLHFMQNLEYHMTFEVLEPNWMEMIAKIQSGKVSNVDQVMIILRSHGFCLLLYTQFLLICGKYCRVPLTGCRITGHLVNCPLFWLGYFQGL